MPFAHNQPQLLTGFLTKQTVGIIRHLRTLYREDIYRIYWLHSKVPNLSTGC